ncbi:MAG: DNA polymerase Y family protein [Pseudomonadota bacterium]
MPPPPPDKGARSDDAAPALRPLVLAAQDRNAQRVHAVDGAARRLGISPGQTLADARAMYPDLDVRPADPPGDGETLKRLADWMRRYTPLVGIGSWDTGPERSLVLDITGCAHLFDGERAMGEDIRARLQGFGFQATTGIAGTVGMAVAAAHFLASALVEAGEEEAALASLPLAALRIPAIDIAALKRLGLVAVCDVLKTPRAPLTARFGKGLLVRLDQALGKAGETLSPRLPVPDASVERRFAEPLVLMDSIEAATAALADRLASHLEPRGTGGRTFTLTLFRVDGHVQSLTVGTSRPIRAPAHVSRLFREKFATLVSDWDAGYGFDTIRLAADHLQPIETRQIENDGSARAAQEELAALVDQLAARLGPHHVAVSMARDAHVPERAAAFAPALQALDETLKENWAAEAPPLPDRAPTRPLRLLNVPEAIEALAEIPDGPPARFRWRRVMHTVARVEGPERIAPPWWGTAGPEATRDYFRLEDTEGRRFWVYRDGLYGRETMAPRWFMQGTFP